GVKRIGSRGEHHLKPISIPVSPFKVAARGPLPVLGPEILNRVQFGNASLEADRKVFLLKPHKLAHDRTVKYSHGRATYRSTERIIGLRVNVPDDNIQSTGIIPQTNLCQTQ